MSEAINKSEIREKIIEALKGVYDPEIPVNIYDLGLIYEIQVNDDMSVYIRMGLTTPFCPMVSSIVSVVEEEVEKKLSSLGFKKVYVDIDISKPWSAKMITKEGREQLKSIYGYDIVEEMIKREEEMMSSEKT
ncbi:DUF59 domain-containing protein [Fervidicoccus fontis]|uniref:Phenylacetic acid degradation protein n=2 Tax=Fervidicoccus fontis TaxID=683846 RepID=I0A2B9_FERFK|nr:iron-sulfur cluster assembly protein [Fervidicoccus fontis]AFH43126.1 phenylacetic acid degradation protein [Fervidicoccus fontis Kam940]MBE9390505.1 DUF59 domain-containing protein [Fervidicoccus fontis]PMB75866.1 MAG: DUF59 domain-containing protein [Fervidicoccus fontis]PMB77745.1 MAG: DUF59 domain-containing protein [Fervidicoccus fontis]HEW64287.1 DUF59 domain-containing protein [Fervidicoccus fontis]